MSKAKGEQKSARPVGSILNRGDGKVLMFGLGVNGDRRMWVREQPFHQTRPGYESAPYSPMTLDYFGATGL